MGKAKGRGQMEKWDADEGAVASLSLAVAEPPSEALSELDRFRRIANTWCSVSLSPPELTEPRPYVPRRYALLPEKYPRLAEGAAESSSGLPWRKPGGMARFLDASDPEPRAAGDAGSLLLPPAP